MRSILSLFLILPHIMLAQEKEIMLYEGVAPGSETWMWKEGVNNKNSVKVMTVFNVVRPSLTVFRPDNGTGNGTAVIIAPGGGFHFLAIDDEGNNAARWLAKKGITVFVLKYRLVHIFSENPFDDMLSAKDKKAWDAESDPIIPLAAADGRAAISYVRAHADLYGIDPQKIGMMGFSAGGRVAAATAFEYQATNRPDFVVLVYADMQESMQKAVLPDSPPLFLACSQDDDFGFAEHALRMYEKWHGAGRPVEMHLFGKGGHGFGVGNPDNTTYQWLDKLGAWLTMEGLMKGK